MLIGEAIAHFIYFVIEVTRSICKVASAETAWGILVLLGISVVISILEGNVKILRPRLKHKEEDEEDYEIVLRRKRK